VSSVVVVVAVETSVVVVCNLFFENNFLNARVPVSQCMDNRTALPGKSHSMNHDSSCLVGTLWYSRSEIKLNKLIQFFQLTKLS